MCGERRLVKLPAAENRGIAGRLTCAVVIDHRGLAAETGLAAIIVAGVVTIAAPAVEAIPCRAGSASDVAAFTGLEAGAIIGASASVDGAGIQAGVAGVGHGAGVVDTIPRPASRGAAH